MFSILAFWQGKARDREVGNGLRVAIGGGYCGSFRFCQNAKLL